MTFSTTDIDRLDHTSEMEADAFRYGVQSTRPAKNGVDLFTIYAPDVDGTGRDTVELLPNEALHVIGFLAGQMYERGYGAELAAIAHLGHFLANQLEDDQDEEN